jgi:hypothetical protein
LRGGFSYDCESNREKTVMTIATNGVEACVQQKQPWDVPRITATPIASQGSSRPFQPAPQPAMTLPPNQYKWGIKGDSWLGYPVG